MLPEVSLLCIGHSHVACVQDAAREREVSLAAINFWQTPSSLVRNANGAWMLGETIIDLIAHHNAPVFSMVGGASYGVLGLLVHPRRWDFILPNVVDYKYEIGAELIPFDAVKLILKGLMQEYLDITLQIANNSSKGVFHIEPPPPYADASRIMPHIPWGLYAGMRREVSPAPLRLKLWLLQSEILKEHCLHHGIVFVPHPAEAVDAAGFMDERFFLDGAHANSAYGALVLRQMREIYEASI